MYQIKNSSLKIGNTLIEYIITGTEHIITRNGVPDHIIMDKKHICGLTYKLVL